MGAEIFRFELRQQLRAPLFWMVALGFALLAFAFMTTDAVAIGGSSGSVYRNAPLVIVNLLGVFTLLGLFLITIFVAGAILRDFNQHSAEMMFATPVRKSAYLGGRFSAGFVVALVVMVVTALALLLGTFMPWLEADRIGPTSLAAYGWAFGVIVIPDLLLLSALLFLIASVTRSMLATYIGVIAFFVLQTISGVFVDEITHRTAAALIDPFGLSAISLTTRYWSVAEQNARLPELTGLLLANRAIWLAVTAALLALTWALFRPTREGLRWRRRRRRPAPAAAGAVSAAAPVALPAVQPRHDGGAHFIQYRTSARRYTWSVLRGVPFLVMLLFGLLNLGANLSLSGMIYGTPTLPVTYQMVAAIRGSFQWLLWIIIIFYAGELIWRERSLRASEVSDAMPVPSWVPLAAKLTALTGVIVIFHLVAMAFTMGWQVAHGYLHLEPLVYLKAFALDAVPFLFIAVAAVFLQVLANNKFLGYLFIILLLAGKMTLGMMHLENKLYNYASAPGVPYSDLNGFGHFWIGAAWFDLYWAWFALALLVATVLLWVRGTAQGWSARKREARARCTRPARFALALAAAGFVATGAWIAWNTMVLNAYEPSDVAEERAAVYEKEYKQYAELPQPRITDVRVDVDLEPYARRARFKAHYRLENKNEVPVERLYVNLDAFGPHATLQLDRLQMPAHEVELRDERRGITIYRLAEPLAPGAAMDFDFDLTLAPRGFGNSAGSGRLVYNGTFLPSALLPSFGYDAGGELRGRSTRRKHGLDPDAPVMPALSEDPAARMNTYISHDADWIGYESTVCTAADQIALTPGKLQREWTRADGSRCFHYRMDQPMLNFYSWVSARYAVARDRWHDVAIEVYHNPEHAWNVERMIAAVKHSLDYYEREFTPYQFDQVRILEFPRYETFAQSFPNTIPYSEGIGFIADVSDPEKIDYVTYVTAHEVAHQWWAHQVIGADMQGSTLLSEGLAQYSALMVMRELYGEAKMRKFLKYELDRYLMGRAVEASQEQPLAKVENQPYIHYRKGSVVFYALQDYIGTPVMNAMLKRFLEDKGFQQPPYTNTIEFMDALAAAAGPQWTQLLDDWFWKITLYDNRIRSARAVEAAGGGWDVTLDLHAGVTRADAEGNETAAAIDIPVDIAVFARAESGEEDDERVLFHERRKLADGDSTITVHVDEKPFEAGIDPWNKLVDRVSGDNRIKVTFP